MGYRPELEAKKDHSHYAACRGRKADIDKYCQALFVYTLAAGIAMILLTLYGIRFRLISLIPSMLGDYDDIRAISAQITIILGIVILSILNYGKRKIFGVAVLAIYLLMLVLSLVQWEGLTDFFGLAFGFMGVLRSWRSVFIMADYNILAGTEGFPLFSEHLVDAVERTRMPVRDPVGNTDSNMSEPENFAEPAVFTGGDRFAEMPGLPDVSQLSGISGLSSDDPDIEYPMDGRKFCRISESPIKTT